MRLRISLLSAFCLASLLFCGQGMAQDWAQKMFKIKSHDFGTVAAGAQTVYEFEFQNLYKEDVHVRSVRSSCGCTDVSVKNESLKSWDKGQIVAKFNTERFRGNRSATITVVIDKPFSAEVQLQVKGNIRGDLTFNPGMISFDEVKTTKPKVKTVRITKYGNINWEIQDVRSTYTHVAVGLKQVHRGHDSVSYDMTISTKPSAPEGFIQNELIIVTNDRSARQIPISMTGKIVAPLQMSPSIVTFGTLKPGESATKKVLLKADQPFEVSDVTCSDKSFVVTTKGGSRKLHFLEISYQGSEDPGTVKQDLMISTSICEQPVKLPVIAEIVK